MSPTELTYTFARPLRRVVSLSALALLLLTLLAGPVAANERLEEFTRKFGQAMSVNDGDQMAKLVKRYQVEAVQRVEQLCSRVAVTTSEEIESEIHLLDKAWRASMKSRFVERHYSYLALMKAPRVAERTRLKAAFDVQLARFIENQAEQDGPTFERVGAKMKALAEAFEELGDRYYAARAWMVYGLAFTEENRGRAGADKQKIFEGYRHAVEAFEQLDLKYTRYHEVLPIYRSLEAEGWGRTLDDPDAALPGVPAAAGGAVRVELSFELIDELDRFARPNYFADELYQMWPILYFDAGHPSTRFPWIERGPSVLRTASSQVDIDVDGDGAGDVQLRLSGKPTLTEFDLPAGANRRSAFLSTIGIQNENYQDLQVNLEPYEDQLSLYYINAGSAVGMLGDTPIRVIDDNMDGIYGSAPKLVTYVGLSEGRYQPDMDSVVVGRSKRALPWSEFLQVDDQWYRVESAGSSAALSATPMSVETGTLRLKFDGPPVEWLIVRGEAALENTFFDLRSAGKKAVEVPVGGYTLYVGELSKGKKQQITKSLVLPGGSTPTWTVAAGEETVVELGAPFGFEFTVLERSDTITVVGRSVTIVGSAGERYERTWACAPRPEVSVRAVGSRKGSRGKKMPIVLDLYEENRDGTYRYTYADVWRPLDYTVELKEDVAMEVRLVEKKNKLFGKVESKWQ